MQLPWDEHLREIVIPAWQAYLSAEHRLTQAVLAKDEAATERARFDALREGGAASFYLHHFGEVVLRARPHWLPGDVTKPPHIISWLAPFCTALRTDRQLPDVELLRDVADSLKHAILTRRLEERQVAANEAVLVADTVYGAGRFGEGKWGGVLQVIVLTETGGRALSAVLQNVLDAWRRAAGLQVPEIGDA
jgi:hypothetical protein